MLINLLLDLVSSVYLDREKQLSWVNMLAPINELIVVYDLQDNYLDCLPLT